MKTLHRAFLFDVVIFYVPTALILNGSESAENIYWLWGFMTFMYGWMAMNMSDLMKPLSETWVKLIQKSQDRNVRLYLLTSIWVKAMVMMMLLGYVMLGVTYFIMGTAYLLAKQKRLTLMETAA